MNFSAHESRERWPSTEDATCREMEGFCRCVRQNPSLAVMAIALAEMHFPQKLDQFVSKLNTTQIPFKDEKERLSQASIPHQGRQIIFIV